MQSTQLRALTAAPQLVRYLTLMAVMLLGTALLAVSQAPPDSSPARWPTDDALFGVDNWAVGGQRLEGAWGVEHVSRQYVNTDGTMATLIISTSPVAKTLYKSGAEVPFSGSGYTAEPAPPGLVPTTAGRDALVARRGSEAWLLVYGYGERRGLLGNGALGWAMVALDTSLRRENDYFLLRVIAPLNQSSSAVSAAEVVKLSDTLFPRLAAWYASAG